MRIKFSKYHGLGNDFILTRYIEGIDIPTLVQACCSRHTGIGADGMIFVKEDPLEMVYYNQNGSRAPMCGNGIRCFAAYCFDEGINTDEVVPVQTLAGEKIVHLISTSPFEVCVDMEQPLYDNHLIDVDEHENVWKREVCGVDTYSLFMATTHTVVFVDFIQVIDDTHITVMTYERGCGITLACGTGACASVVVANKLGFVQSECEVQLKLGSLKIEVKDHVYMTGPAKKICEGEFVC